MSAYGTRDRGRPRRNKIPFAIHWRERKKLLRNKKLKKVGERNGKRSETSKGYSEKEEEKERKGTLAKGKAFSTNKKS